MDGSAERAREPRAATLTQESDAETTAVNEVLRTYGPWRDMDDVTIHRLIQALQVAYRVGRRDGLGEALRMYRAMQEEKGGE